jgi:phage/plasmid-associated DNA primase
MSNSPQSQSNYIPGAHSKLWARFLEDVFLGDYELIAYVQRALGYSITERPESGRFLSATARALTASQRCLR